MLVAKLLLVDDDRDLVDIIHYGLRRAGFEVLVAYDSPMALRQLQRNHPHLLVLDISLGADNGFDLIKHIRRDSRIPIIVLSGQGREEDKIRGLELGADDYVSKPFGHGELLARVRALFRRSEQAAYSMTEGTNNPSRTQLEIGPLTLKPARHIVLKHGQRLNLTATEYRLLHYLMVNEGSVLSPETIAKHVWGYEDGNSREIVRVTVYRLRKKLEDDPANPELLCTVLGVGFVLDTQR